MLGKQHPLINNFLGGTAFFTSATLFSRGFSIEGPDISASGDQPFSHRSVTRASCHGSGVKPKKPVSLTLAPPVMC